MLSATPRDSYILLQNGSPLLSRHGHKVNAVAASLTENRLAIQRFDVLNPCRFCSEHRYEISLAVYSGNYHRSGACAARFASLHFEDGLEFWRQPEP